MPGLVARARTRARVAGLLGACACLSACPSVPEIAYETDHFEVAPDFDYPICAGTLAHFESHLDFVESSLGRSLPFGQRIRFYWITQDLDSWCSERAVGCYYPGTSIIIGTGESVSHEIVHAVLNAEAQTNFFLEEALAELYSGVGALHSDSKDLRPNPAELLWLSPADYRYGELDYAVAGHFMSYVERRFGGAPTRGIADVVVTAAGPPDLERTFERFTGVAFDEIEQDWDSDSATYYRGLREGAVPEVLTSRFYDLSLRCDEATTYGPLPDAAEPGMYRTMRLELDEPQAIDVDLRAPGRVQLQIVDARRERGTRNVLDFFHPQLSGAREHPTLRGGEAGSYQLRAGTHLVVVSQAGYDYADVFLSIVRREFPRRH